MNLTDWAKREIEIACKRRCVDGCGIYTRICYDSAYKAFQSLAEDGHSGMSIRLTQAVLNRLIDKKPLTPIEDTPEIWHEVTYAESDHRTYQCSRMSSLFKSVYPDGTVKYSDVGRVHCVDIQDPNGVTWTNGFVTNLIDDMHPITMPYFPASEPYTVRCEEFLFGEDGDFDTLGVIYAVTPDGSTEYIHRYFKESADSFEEIDVLEFYERKTRRK